MLKIDNLKVLVEEKEVLKWVSIDFELGKNYAFLWKNWSGKSSMALTIMWHPKYQVIWWDIIIDWESIKDMSADLRSKKWIFLAFQNIPEVPGVKLFDFLKAIYNAHLPDWEQHINFLWFKKIIDPLLLELGIDREFLFRDLNVWFSGWEKRKIEILQLKLLKPKYIILDEIDSWLDINSIRQLGEMLKTLDSRENCFIIISHYFDILDYVTIDKVYVLENWLVKLNWEKKLIEEIKEKGF